MVEDIGWRMRVALTTVVVGDSRVAGSEGQEWRRMSVTSLPESGTPPVWLVRTKGAS